VGDRVACLWSPPLRELPDRNSDSVATGEGMILSIVVPEKLALSGKVLGRSGH
jgi:hypothetical protein